MKSSTRSRAVESSYCTGGLFMKRELALNTGPPMPRSIAILHGLDGVDDDPAELSESQTSSCTCA
jgi:hypothetical protein